MIFSFLNPDNIYDKFTESKRYTELLTEPFPEFERIARNRPHAGIDPKLPKTTDGTAASIVRKTPKRVVQQLPTGTIEADDDNDWLPILAEFVYQYRILPYANEEYDLIQKCWSVIEKGLTFGSHAVYTPFLNHCGQFTPDMTTLYWGDVFIQPGKKSGYDSSYVFMRSWWQPEDIQALIDKEAKLKASAKQRGEAYESSWDIKALESILETITLKDDKASTPSEEERNVNPSGIELVTAFQKGVNAPFYTFNPADEVIVRTKYNKDPRGKMPIDWFYSDTDGSNPLGRGIIELIGGLQNLIDSDMQMYQYNRALMLAPPIVKRGDFPKSRIVYAPNHIIDLGSDQNARIDPLSIDTSAVANYPNMYGLQKSMMLNLVSSPDTSISAEVGNPGFGKTPSAIQAQQNNVSVDDNYLRKMFEAFFENWSETAINMYFAERSGVEELQLNKETAQKLRKLAKEGKFDESLLSEDNKILIDYDSATPALRFRVDASTSKMKSDADQLEALTGLLGTLEQSPVLQQIIPPEKILGAWNAIVSASGVEDPENLTLDPEEFKATQAQLQAEQQAQQQTAQLNQAQEGEVVQPPDTSETQPMGQLDPEDEQIVSELQALGFGDDVIIDAVNMLDDGMSADEVLTALGAVQNGR